MILCHVFAVLVYSVIGNKYLVTGKQPDTERNQGIHSVPAFMETCVPCTPVFRWLDPGQEPASFCHLTQPGHDCLREGMSCV